PRNLAVKLKEMDLALPGQSGVQVFEHQVRFADGSKRDVVLHKAAYEDAAGCLAGSVGVLIDITERKRAELKSEKSLKKLRKAVEGAVHALVTTVEIKDPYTFGHQQRVSKLAYAIGREMGLSAKIIEGIRLAGLVHDLGKIYVPSEILSKPSKLNSLGECCKRPDFTLNADIQGNIWSYKAKKY
ncbi:MAG: HD domain-containing phosphohydrolase, partial [Bacillota bacterium]